VPTLPTSSSPRAARKSDAEVTCFINNLGLGYQFAGRASSTARPRRAAPPDLPTGLSPKTCILRRSANVRRRFPAIRRRLRPWRPCGLEQRTDGPWRASPAEQVALHFGAGPRLKVSSCCWVSTPSAVDIMLSTWPGRDRCHDGRGPRHWRGLELNELILTCRTENCAGSSATNSRLPKSSMRSGCPGCAADAGSRSVAKYLHQHRPR